MFRRTCLREEWSPGEGHKIYYSERHGQRLKYSVRFCAVSTGKGRKTPVFSLKVTLRGAWKSDMIYGGRSESRLNGERCHETGESEKLV